MKRFWEWLNRVETLDGWSPLQAIVFVALVSPFVYLVYLTA